MKTILIAAIVAALFPEPDLLDSATVRASGVTFKTPMVTTQISSEKLRKQNPQNSLPMTLGYEASVLSSNEGGTGLGYSNLRIRGVGGYQTNVTLNGITLNDAESQEVFWVNIPSLEFILSDVVIQRGLGTSANGPGAFGASINMTTAVPGHKPTVRFDAGYGSYNTFTPSVYFSTGKTAKGIFVQGAYSYNTTDGYMDNAFAKVQSIYASGGWIGKKDSFKITFLQGMQHSGITWNGVPFDIYPKNRTYNAKIGDTDNFRQSHIQANYIHDFGRGLSWNTTLNYTDGYGYYDISKERDVLDNGLWVLRSQLDLHNRIGTFSAGAYISDYRGNHNGSSYDNNSRKQELNFYARAEVGLSPAIILYGDIQYRGIKYGMHGPDEYSRTLDFDLTYDFLNPRAGVTWLLSDRHKFFTSIAYGNREPSRADLQASPLVRPEHMIDWETGFERAGRLYSSSLVFYLMNYSDMLIETGYLDDSGYAIKTNIPRGYRRGLEWTGRLSIAKFFTFEHNLTISSNRTSEGRDILLSPSAMGMIGFIIRSPFGTELDIHHKFVGKQYWDNSGNPEHMIPNYNFADLTLTQDIHLLRTKFTVGLYVHNLWNNYFFSYAHAYGVFPQAPRNYMFRLKFEF